MLSRLVTAVLLLLATPLVTGAQQETPVRRVGWLSATSPASAPSSVDPFRDALREFGRVEGRGLVIVYRYAEGRLDRLPALATDLVRMNVDVILATTPATLEAARQATRTVPIVMVYGPDPVEAGLVDSLAHPGRNITGLTSLSVDLGLKQLDLLKEMVPGLSRVAVLWNPANPWHGSGVKRLEVAARGLGVRLHPVGVRGPEQFDEAFAAMARARVGAILSLPDPMTFVHRARLVALAARHRLPTMNGLIDYTEAGGLASYWPNSVEMFRRAAGYVHRILGGTRPADLPIEQPTKFELVINLRTARALGLKIPPAVLARTDRVIE